MWHVWVSSFGVVSAILVVGGYVLLQWQRNSYRFQLSKAALERGLTDAPGGPPYWLTSLRQGIMMLALGIGLLAAGGAGYGLASNVTPPPVSEIQSTAIAPAAEEATGDAGKRAAKPPRPRPPHENPALRRWERAQQQQTVGLAAMGCGLVVTLLGAVRTGFARAERKYSSGSPESRTL